MKAVWQVELLEAVMYQRSDALRTDSLVHLTSFGKTLSVPPAAKILSAEKVYRVKWNNEMSFPFETPGQKL